MATIRDQRSALRFCEEGEELLAAGQPEGARQAAKQGLRLLKASSLAGTGRGVLGNDLASLLWRALKHL